MSDDDLILPDFLDRKLHPELNSELPRNISYKVKNPSKIIWPKKRIEQVMRAKAREAKRRKKEAAKAAKRK